LQATAPQLAFPIYPVKIVAFSIHNFLKRKYWQLFFKTLIYCKLLELTTHYVSRITNYGTHSFKHVATRHNGSRLHTS
ncbi:MAG TPA: hypothetical protein VEC36_02135, partial [Patescibacteria group bacterium]|nr:hypothetical protein [Patescibacteria group bacterium]